MYVSKTVCMVNVIEPCVKGTEGVGQTMVEVRHHGTWAVVEKR
jgi:hypothetical protein